MLGTIDGIIHVTGSSKAQDHTTDGTQQEWSEMAPPDSPYMVSHKGSGDLHLKT